MRALGGVMLMLAACGAGRRGHGDENARPIVAEADPGAAAPEACADVPLVTAAQLAAGERAGERIAVEGVPRVETACTLKDCGDAKCCNRCQGSYQLAGAADQRIELAGLRGCHGLDCALTCEPFGSAPTQAYRFVGRHAFEPAGATSIYATSTIAVETICRVAAAP